MKDVAESTGMSPWWVRDQVKRGAAHLNLDGPARPVYRFRAEHVDALLRSREVHMPTPRHKRRRRNNRTTTISERQE